MCVLHPLLILTKQCKNLEIKQRRWQQARCINKPAYRLFNLDLIFADGAIGGYEQRQDRVPSSAAVECSMDSKERQDTGTQLKFPAKKLAEY